MDFLQFVASRVQSLAWPAAAVLRRLDVSRAPKCAASFASHEVSRTWMFRSDLEKAEKEAAALPRRRPLHLDKKHFRRRRAKRKAGVLSLVQLSPRAAILEASMDIESELRSLAESLKVSRPGIKSMLGLTRLLRSRNIIDSPTAALLDDLRAIRNNAAHNPDAQMTVDEAERYRVLVDEVIDRLRILAMMQKRGEARSPALRRSAAGCEKSNRRACSSWRCAAGLRA